MKQLLHIEKLIFGGLGLARTKNGIIFVRDVLPGEEIYATHVEEIGGQKYAIFDKIALPSPHRREPLCKNFGACGGCNWLFSDYEMQISSKKDIFIECLARIGKITISPQFKIFRSPEVGYRRRVQLKINEAHNAIGFFRRKSREVIAVRHCPLLRNSLNSLLENSPTILKLLPRNFQEIKCIEGINNSIASSPILEKLTCTHTEIRINNHSFIISGDNFFQSNAYICENLEIWGKEVIEKGEYFVDLYGGIGFLAILFNESFNKGTIVDSIKSHIDSARKNLAENSISHINARHSSAEEFLSECSHRKVKIDCLIVDPPRPGLTNHVREKILECLPSSIFYVSCNPSTQARDIGFLTRQAGYTIDKLALFDFYPNTHHIETVITLKH